ncbi:hypothetical protein VNO77_36325 [Canavalia gladiata]|uniref:Uncharacterized protein n=1 Tax=Canavalia gladiata TaxID=3824 RepID=A0AAN9PXP3_CANGL
MVLPRCIFFKILRVCISGVVPGLCFLEFLMFFLGSILWLIQLFALYKMCCRVPTLIVCKNIAIFFKHSVRVGFLMADGEICSNLFCCLAYVAERGAGNTETN